MTHKPRLHVHTSSIPMRWGDMDALGHVNNTVYFRYMEQTRTEWIHALAPLAGGPEMLPIVIVNASCTFLRPLVYPGTVEVRLSLGEAGRTSVGSFYELACANELYAEGAAKIVWIDPATGRPAPLPAFVTRLLQPPATSGGVAVSDP